jgi:hypothetical protein
MFSDGRSDHDLRENVVKAAVALRFSDERLRHSLYAHKNENAHSQTFKTSLHRNCTLTHASYVFP